MSISSNPVNRPNSPAAPAAEPSTQTDRQAAAALPVSPSPAPQVPGSSGSDSFQQLPAQPSAVAGTPASRLADDTVLHEAVTLRAQRQSSSRPAASPSSLLELPGPPLSLPAPLPSLPAPPLGLPAPPPLSLGEKLERLQNVQPDRPESRTEALDLLQQAPPSELDALVRSVDLPRLFSAFETAEAPSTQRTELLGLLGEKRLADLSIPARAAVLDALQTRPLGPDEQNAVRSVFLGTHGAELTELKNRVDAGRNHHDLQKLVFRDLQDPAIRTELLDHFAKEAVPTGEVKVLSDLDDTFFSSQVDQRYPRGTVFPGVRDFIRELDRAGTSKAPRDGDLAFVTARAGDLAGAEEKVVHDLLTGLQAPEATALLGPPEEGGGKFENFWDYHKLFPEYAFTWTGDSSHNDTIDGLQMRASSGDAVKGIFIHNITGKTAAQQAEARKKGVFLFDTYVGAAVDAFQQGILDQAALNRVGQGALQALAAVPFTSDSQRRARQSEFQKDIARANALLPPELQIPFQP